MDPRTALIAALSASALLLPVPGRADITEDFAKALAAEAAAAAVPDLRAIPEGAVKGVMFPPQGRLVAIDKKVMMLAPGSKIRDLDNRIVMPSTITEPVNVRYTVDLYSHVHRVWLMGGEVKLDKDKKDKKSEDDSEKN